MAVIFRSKTVTKNLGLIHSEVKCNSFRSENAAK